EKNSVNLDFSGGYSAYVEHPGYDRWFVNPHSGMSFDIYSGDTWMNFHDRFSITENSYVDPTLQGFGNYSQFQNVAGIMCLWDFNKLIIRGGYDHANYLSLTGVNIPDGDSDVFYGSAACKLRSELNLGLETGGGLNQYSNTETNTPYTDAT